MRFEKGQSGNPGGRPKAYGEIRELARQHTELALRTLAEIAERGENESARVSAANAILDRGWGKPAVPVVAAEVPPVITLDFGTTLWPPRPAIEQAEHSVVDVTPPFLRAPRNDAT
jgi:Family of unknown function (DUF5681)